MSPISSPSLDASIGLPTAQSIPSASIAVEAGGTAASGVNWLLTWLGQTQPLADADAADAGAPEPATTTEPAELPQQVQWLTLLPSVPSFQNLFAPVAGDVAALEPVEEVEEETENVVDGGESLLTVPATPIVPVTPATSEPEIPAGSATPLGARGDGATPRKLMDIQRRAGAPVTAPASQPDKGELIWAAEFVVAEKAADSMEIEESAPPAETIPAMRRQKALIDNGTESDSRQQSPEESSPKRPNPKDSGPPSRGPAMEVPVERSAATETLEPAKREAQPSPAVKFEVPVLEAAPPSHLKVEFKSPKVVAETMSAPEVARVELDTARPLRPAQIATLYVDVPAPGGDADAAPLRLAVTQRGDQVNVRLRSWDAGTAPLDNDRMQPLLQSLAEQGYAGAKKSIERVDEGSPLSMEHLKEKPLAPGEAANSNNDRQPFHNGDDRQRKHQERQQQAFLLRRQVQNPNTEQFDLQAQLEGLSSSQQQGAVR